MSGDAAEIDNRAVFLSRDFLHLRIASLAHGRVALYVDSKSGSPIGISSIQSLFNIIRSHDHQG